MDSSGSHEDVSKYSQDWIQPLHSQLGSHYWHHNRVILPCHWTWWYICVLGAILFSFAQGGETLPKMTSCQSSGPLVWHTQSILGAESYSTQGCNLCAKSQDSWCFSKCTWNSCLGEKGINAGLIGGAREGHTDREGQAPWGHAKRCKWT